MRRWEIVMWGVMQWLAVAGILAVAWLLQGWVAGVAVLFPLLVLAAAVALTLREQ